MDRILVMVAIIALAMTACGTTGASMATTPATPTAQAPSPTAARHAGASMADFMAIQLGMTLAQVEHTMGAQGHLVSQTDMAGYTSAIYSWDGDTVPSSVLVTIENGRVTGKSQFGLAS